MEALPPLQRLKLENRRHPSEKVHSLVKSVWRNLKHRLWFQVFCFESKHLICLYFFLTALMPLNTWADTMSPFPRQQIPYFAKANALIAACCDSQSSFYTRASESRESRLDVKPHLLPEGTDFRLNFWLVGFVHKGTIDFPSHCSGWIYWFALSTLLWNHLIPRPQGFHGGIVEIAH